MSGRWPLTVTFTNHSTPTADITGYEWAFGDGYTSTLTNPTHTYTSTGVYTVSLAATGAAGTNVLTRTDYIAVRDPLAVLCDPCSDDFDDGAIDPMWTPVNVGTADQGEEREGALQVTSNGSTIWGGSNSFRYVYQQASSGNFTATVKIVDGPDNEWSSKAGLMVRADATPNSSLAMIMYLGQREVLQLAYRTDSGTPTRVTDDISVANLPVWVRLVRAGNTFTYSHSTNGQNWIEDGSGTPGNMGDEPLLGLAVASYDSNVLGLGEFDDFEVCRQVSGELECEQQSDDFDDGTLAAKWTAANVGTANQGSEWEDGLIVTSNGSTIWGGSNSFRYVYQPAGSGNFTATVKIVDGPDNASASKAGLMVRADATPDSSLAMIMYLNQQDVLQLSYRKDAGTPIKITDNITSVSLPVWVRLVRQEDTFTYYHSANGVTWVEDGSALPEDIGAEPLVGLAVASYDDEVVGRATFGNFELCQVVSALITNSITYTYDPLYRLTSAVYSGTLTNTTAYAHDAVGNRTAMTETVASTVVTTYTYDAANRLTSVGDVTYTYDNNGNPSD